MTSTQNRNIQIKLSLDRGLQNVWSFLAEEYEGLDKAGIVRLALNNLAKATRRQNGISGEFNLLSFLSELDQHKSASPTEKEFAKWWNENK